MTDIEKKLAFLLATSPHLDTLDGSYEKAARDLVANGVVPVVRCKDCKHGRKSDHAYAVDTAKPLCECNFMYGPHQWHEYCSWGKRRDDDADD